MLPPTPPQKVSPECCDSSADAFFFFLQLSNRQTANQMLKFGLHVHAPARIPTLIPAAHRASTRVPAGQQADKYPVRGGQAPRQVSFDRVD